MAIDYATDIYAYLVRARTQLDSNSPESLFYAAFELRSAIESRLQQYLDARLDIARRKEKGWKIINSELELSKVFSDARRIVELTLTAETVPGELRLFHTPVEPALAHAGAKRISRLLHFSELQPSIQEEWWTKEKAFLQSTFTKLEFASSGTLLAPPLMRDGKMDIKAFFHRSVCINPLVDSFVKISKGTRVMPKVRLHSVLPADATPFLNNWRMDLQLSAESGR